MRFSIILLLYDPADTFSMVEEALPLCLERLRRLNGDYELIVVNNSPPAESPHLQEYLSRSTRSFPDAVLVQEEENRGISVGFNDGFRRVRQDADVVVFMSGDAYIADWDLLKRIEHIFLLSQRIGCVHPVSIFEDGPNVCNLGPNYHMEAFYAHLRRGASHCRRIEAEFTEQVHRVVRTVASRTLPILGPLPLVPLTFLCVRADVFRILGGFDESFVGGYENIDLVLRAMSHRYYTVLANRAFIYHRRLLFRTLGQTGPNGEIYRKQMERSASAWRRKYGGEERFTLFCQTWLRSRIVGKMVAGILSQGLRLKHLLHRALMARQN